jgi:hypothetical protein
MGALSLQAGEAVIVVSMECPISSAYLATYWERVGKRVFS